MKKRVTISISDEALSYVDKYARKRGASRSRAIESLIEETHRRKREEELARLAKDFFAKEESQEERAEREDLLKMSLGALNSDR